MLESAATPHQILLNGHEGASLVVSAFRNRVVDLMEESEPSDTRDPVQLAIDARSIAASQGVEGEPLLDLPLPYARQILHEVLSEDQLVVLAPGLGLHWIVSAFVLVADIAGTHRTFPSDTTPREKENLVLIVGASPEDIKSLDKHICRLSKGTNLKTRGLSILNAEVDAESRTACYNQGGIYFVTSEILIPDMLRGTASPENITGIVIMHAHRASETNKIAFLVKLFREKNVDGFIKAFSDRPELISFSINGLSNKLRYLGVQKVALWPRFHVLVNESLPKGAVTEIIVEPSESMREIQEMLSWLASFLISDIKRRTGTLVENEHWNVNNALISNLSQTIRNNLSDHWHRLSPEARHSIHELAQMQDLIRALSKLEPVEFYKLYISKMLAQGEDRPQPIWALHEIADKLAVTAYERVNNREGMPKWPHLMDLIRANAGKKILLMCETPKILVQLVKLLHHPDDLAGISKLEFDATTDGDFFMRSKMQKRARQAREDEAAAKAAQTPYKRRRVRGGSKAAAGPSRQEVQAVADSQASSKEEATDNIKVKSESQKVPETIDISFEEPSEQNRLLITEDETIIDLWSSPTPDEKEIPKGATLVVLRLFNSDELLEELRPDVVIMYDLNLKFTRQLEVHEAISNPNLEVSLLYYQQSVEELRFLNDVRCEKDAFTSLIREKAEMPMAFKDAPERQSGTRIISTRVGGLAQYKVITERPRVLVDAREFRSELPHLVWEQNMDVVPLSLVVGDYILSPSIAVERKSVADLRESFINGRLVEQCKKMEKSYSTPMLLIEFSNHCSFSIRTFEELRAKSVRRELQDKLVLLILGFPKLRLIWSASPRHSAEIFEAIKQASNEPEPEPEQALQAGKVQIKNYTAVDMLRAMPGVTARNHHLLLENIDSLADLADMTEVQLEELIGTECARKLSSFLDKKFNAF